MLVSKPASGTTKPALDLVRNQQRIMFLRQPMRRLREVFTHGTDSPFSLKELKTDGANRIVKVALQIGNIVEFHKLHAGNSGSEGRAILFFVRGSERAERPAMEGMFQGQNAPLWLAAV